jgi:polar amino acid transport system substrate-binding protein
VAGVAGRHFAAPNERSMPARFWSAVFAACLGIVASAGLARADQPVLRVASDISYPPLEFYRPGTKTPDGFDHDLALALGAKLGRRVVFFNHDFGTIFAGLASRQYDAVVSAVSDTRAREAKLDFVDYLLVGSGMLAKAGNPDHLSDLSSACGRTVDLQAGTSQEAAFKTQSAACTAVGLRPVTVLAESTDDAALKHFTSGESVAHISDYPTIVYLAQTLGGGHAAMVVGRQFDLAPYGIAVAKTNPSLRDALARALAALVADGTYDRLVHKWHLEQASFRSAPINAGSRY